MEVSISLQSQLFKRHFLNWAISPSVLSFTCSFLIWSVPLRRLLADTAPNIPPASVNASSNKVPGPVADLILDLIVALVLLDVGRNGLFLLLFPCFSVRGFFLLTTCHCRVSPMFAFSHCFSSLQMQKCVSLTPPNLMWYQI